MIRLGLIGFTALALLVLGCGQSSPPEEGKIGEETPVHVEQDRISDSRDLEPVTIDSTKSSGEAPINPLEMEDHKSAENEATEVDFGSKEVREGGG